MNSALSIVLGIAGGALVVGGAWWLLERRANSTAAARSTATPIPTWNPANINGPQAQQTTWVQDAREGVGLVNDIGSLGRDWGLF